MMLESEDLFTLLNKRAGQDENFVTDAFAHVLRHLVVNEPAAASRILQLLTSDRLNLSSEEASQATVITQVSTDSGRPDIEIRCPDWLVYVEVKVNSPKDDSQLVRYLDALQRSGIPNICLVFLTRFPESVELFENEPRFCHARWCQVAEWLQAESAGLHEPVSRYLTSQFTSFLQGRNIAMRQVTPELAPGVTALSSLMMIVREALHRCGLTCKRYGSFDCVGYYCESGKYWMGLYFEEPDALVLETCEFNLADDACQQTDIGGMFIDHWQGGGRKVWTDRIDLAPAPGAFFALSSAEQIEHVSQFVQSCIDRAKRIEATKSGKGGEK